ncbi:MAG: SH3 domain-containing protein [Lachnospiraceae bacterium]|nr:SH3 domain-containing protein [Lachnospiraceae bacterium]
MKNRKHRKILITLLMTLVIMMSTSLSALAATVKANGVNLRNAPTTEGNNIIGSLNKGDTVTILDTVKDKKGNEWYEILLSNGNIAYISASMVDNGEEAPAEEEPQQPAQQPEQQQPQQPAQQQPQQPAQQPEQQPQQPAQQPEQQPEQQTQQPAQQTPAEQTQTPAEQTPAEQTPEEQTPAETTTPEKTPEQIAAEQAAAQQAAEEAAAQNQATIDADRKARISAEDYDPTTDKEARYGIQFLENSDGTGQWYVYNYDTGSKVAISDLHQLAEQETLAKDNAAKASRMRTIIIILVVALVILALFLLWYIFFNRSTPAESRMAAEKRRRARERDKQDGLDYQDENESFDEGVEEDEYVEDDYEDDGYDEDGGDDFDGAAPAAKGAGVKGFFGNLFAKKPAGEKKSRKKAQPDEEDYDEYDDLDDAGEDGDYVDDGGYEDEYVEDDYEDEPAPRRPRRTLEEEDDDMDYDFMK